jgi:LDH2 family malate/lactate/ureidoglycolate dehydrogenase
MPLNFFVEQVRELVRHVKSSPPATGFEEVVVPGEIEARHRARSHHEGIVIEDAVWHELTAIVNRLGVSAVGSVSVR